MMENVAQPSVPDEDQNLAGIGHRVDQAFADLHEFGIDDPSPYNDAIDNEWQRFRNWATLLGLYHLGHSSLDYRFRDAPLLYEFAWKMLHSLRKYLSQSKLVMHYSLTRI